jgi:hypothetical protein
MCVLLVREMEVLGTLARGPRSHFELAVEFRRCVGHLWARRFIQLKSPDTWMITDRGRAMLDCGGSMH